jgi:hypothetical protein
LLADGAHLGSVSNLTYRPNQDFNGADSFTFRANDGIADSEIATVFITVNAVNDRPVAMARSVSVNEDERVEIVLLAEDVDGDALTYTMQAPAHGTLSGTPPFLSYQSAKDYYGPDSFTFLVNDGTAQSAEAIVNITVLPVNDPPVANSQIVTTDEDALVAVTLAATDVEGDPLTFFVTPPAHGTLTGAPPNLIYRPAANYYGPDRFTFMAHDGRLDSVEAAVNITVLPVQDPPVADASATPQRRLISANNSNALVVLDGSRSWDVDDDPLQFAWFDGDAETQFASGRIVASLMNVGTNAVTLRVSDGVATATDGLLVSIVTAAQAVQELIAQVNVTGLPEKLKRPLTATLESASDKFDRGIVPAGTGQLDAFQNKVRAQAAAIGPARAEEFIRTAQEIIDVFGASRRPALLGCVGKADRRIALRGAGAAGKVCLLQASSDLLTWETIGTVTARQDGSFEFEDANTARFACRFYRAASPE